ncbi:MAG: hypothetical protein H8E42_05165 [Nitrospinae bacterium]|nr:hypothetical protein [Nitrospinota bacterium]
MPWFEVEQLKDRFLGAVVNAENKETAMLRYAIELGYSSTDDLLNDEDESGPRQYIDNRHPWVCQYSIVER